MTWLDICAIVFLVNVPLIVVCLQDADEKGISFFQAVNNALEEAAKDELIFYKGENKID